MGIYSFHLGGAAVLDYDLTAVSESLFRTEPSIT